MAILLGVLVGTGAAASRSDRGDSRAVRAAATLPDLAYVKAQVNKFKRIPTFFKVPKFDASKAKGKRVALIPFSTSVPFISLATNAIGDALKVAGVKSTLFPSQGQLSQIQQAFSTAIGQKYDAIATFSVNAANIGPQLVAAKQAGIPVVIGHVDPIGVPLPPNASANTPAPFYEAGRLEADYVILHSKGHARTLVITSNEQTPARGTVSAIEDEFKTRCGPGCATTVVNVPIADWATKVQSQVQSSLIKDRDINYIIPLYDSATQFVLPAITAAGATDRVKIVTFNGTPFVLDLLTAGKSVIFDVGEDTRWLGWAIADQALRLLSGVRPVADEHTPLRIFDASNVAEAGRPAKFGKGYGGAYIAGYKATWGLK